MGIRWYSSFFFFYSREERSDYCSDETADIPVQNEIDSIHSLYTVSNCLINSSVSFIIAVDETAKVLLRNEIDLINFLNIISNYLINSSIL